MSARRGFRAVIGCSTLLVAGQGFANEPPASLASLFPREAEVFASRPGLVRLELPAEVLADCRPDLSDLRVFDLAGRELAYLVEGEAVGTGELGLEAVQRSPLRVLQARREQIDRAPSLPRHRESFVLELPGASAADSLALIASVRAAEFVALVDVEGLDETNQASRLIDDSSLFRLPRSGAEKLRLELPPFGGPRLRVVLESEQAGWLEPSFVLEQLIGIERRHSITLPLAVRARREEPGRTVLEVERPRGIVPHKLRVATHTRNFDRGLEVRDGGSGGYRKLLGAGRIFRIESLVPAGEQELALAPATGHFLSVEIDNGDSPPLEGLELAAILPQPALVLALEVVRADSEPVAILRYGGARAQKPRYDLAALPPRLGEPLAGQRAAAALAVHDRSIMERARLAPSRPNPLFDGGPALAFAMRPGAEIDRRPFRYRRRLAVPEAREGLSKLALAPADLAVLDEGLTDLRVTDEGSRQWPYLVELEAEQTWLVLTVEGPEQRAGVSRYRLRAEVPTFVARELRIESDARFIEREFRVEAELDDGTRTLAAGRLTRAIGASMPLSVPLTAVRTEEIRLEIQDGDEAPLVLRTVEARLALPVLYLTAPAGDYDLLLGAPDQASPRYELEQVREIVLAVEAAAIEASALADNPRFSLGARLGQSGAAQTVALWTVLVGAAAALVVLTLRLARSR